VARDWRTDVRKVRATERPDTRLHCEPHPDHGAAHRRRHGHDHDLPTGRPVFRRNARRCCCCGRGCGGQRRIPNQCTDAGPGRRYGCADRACCGAQGSPRRQSGLQPGGRSVGAVRPVDAGRGIGAVAPLYARCGRRRGYHRSGHSLSVVVHARTGAAVRHAGDGVGATRHRYRAAEHAGRRSR
jgi:hypothetical protein